MLNPLRIHIRQVGLRVRGSRPRMKEGLTCAMLKDADENQRDRIRRCKSNTSIQVVVAGEPWTRGVIESGSERFAGTGQWSPPRRIWRSIEAPAPMPSPLSPHPPRRDDFMVRAEVIADMHVNQMPSPLLGRGHEPVYSRLSGHLQLRGNGSSLPIDK